MLGWDQPGPWKPREISHSAHSLPDSNSPGTHLKTLTLRPLFPHVSHHLGLLQPWGPRLQMGAARKSLQARVPQAPGLRTEQHAGTWWARG